MSQIFILLNCKSKEFVCSFVHLFDCLFVHFQLSLTLSLSPFFFNHLHQTKSNVKEINKKIMIAMKQKRNCEVTETRCIESSTAHWIGNGINGIVRASDPKTKIDKCKSATFPLNECGVPLHTLFLAFSFYQFLDFFSCT